MIKRWHARTHRLQSRPPIQRLRTLRQILGIDQAFHRHGHKIAIRHVAPTICKREPRSIANQAPALWIFSTQSGQVVAIQHSQDLPNRQRPRRGWPHPTDLMRAISSANRGTLFDLIAAHVGHAQHTRITTRVAHGSHNFTRDITVIKIHRPVLGEITQRLCIVRIA